MQHKNEIQSDQYYKYDGKCEEWPLTDYLCAVYSDWGIKCA